MQIIPLPAFDYLRVSGPDAKAFLQGQLTCNLDLLRPEHALAGAICNLKGRVITDFLLLQDAADCLLQIPPGNGELLRQTLAKYAVFSKVELTLEAGPRQIYGAIGPEVPAAFSECLSAFPAADFELLRQQDFLTLRLPGAGGRYQIWCLSEAAVTRLGQLDALEDMASLSDWQGAEIRAGIVHVTPAMSEEYTPQLLNYDINGNVDFKKGCYTGQEIVARMFYRGKPKQRLFLLASEAPLHAESSIYRPEQPTENVADILVSAAAGGAAGGSLALAIMATELAASGVKLQTGSEANFSVQILPIPYTE